MREPTYFILLSLMDKPRHGYGIIKRSKELSESRVRLAAGTLYGALDRLTKEGLVEAGRSTVVEGRNRRYYLITDKGRRAAIAEVDRLRSSVTMAESVGIRDLGVNPS